MKDSINDFRLFVFFFSPEPRPGMQGGLDLTIPSPRREI